MKYFYFLITALTVAVSGQSFALDAPELHVSQETVKNRPACPSQDFREFLNVFSESIVIQRAFTKYPLKKRQLKVKAGSEPRPFVRHLDRNQINFPVIPAETERREKHLILQFFDYSGPAGEAMLVKSDTDFQILFKFEKNSCWQLTSIDDQTFDDGAVANTEATWLQKIFRSPTNCTPKNLYYDKEYGASVGKILENKGYTANHVGEQLAEYKIHELFYGLPATALAIPSDTDSIYRVSVAANAKTLANKIRSTTGADLVVYNAKMKAKSGIAYIVSDSATASSFVCSTFEE